MNEVALVKIRSLLITLFLLTTAGFGAAQGACSYAEFANYSLGDVNADGKVSSGDALLIFQMAAGVRTNPTERQFYHSDLNGDGQVSSGDVLLALRK